MMGPTKGIWKAVGRGIFADAEFGEPDAGYVEYDEAIANAHLIAAAPDILSVLEGIIEHGLLDKRELILSAANAAIVKAKGGA